MQGKRNVVLVILFFGLLSLLSLNSNASVLDHQSVTWNMQSADGLGQESASKWMMVAAMLRNTQEPVQVVALQESGAVPLAARPMPTRPSISGPGASRIPIEVLQWNIGTRMQPDNVYIYHAVPERTNVALVSRQQAEEIILFAAIYPGTNPVVGIRMGNDYFFSLQAAAGNDNEAPKLLLAIENYMNRVLYKKPHATWLILGDYNRTPHQLDPPAVPSVYRHIISSHTITQQSGDLFDYAVAGHGTEVLPQTALAFPCITSLLQHCSDHVALRFGPSSSSTTG